MEANALFPGIEDERVLWLEATIRELPFAWLDYIGQLQFQYCCHVSVLEASNEPEIEFIDAVTSSC